MTGDNPRDLIAEAIRNAECDQQPKCVWCMTMSVLAELDRAGLVVVSAEDLRAVLGEVWSPEFYSAVLPRLRAVLPERTGDVREPS